MSQSLPPATTASIVLYAPEIFEQALNTSVSIFTTRNEIMELPIVEALLRATEFTEALSAALFDDIDYYRNPREVRGLKERFELRQIQMDSLQTLVRRALKIAAQINADLVFLEGKYQKRADEFSYRAKELHSRAKILDSRLNESTSRITRNVGGHFKILHKIAMRAQVVEKKDQTISTSTQPDPGVATRIGNFVWSLLAMVSSQPSESNSTKPESKSRG